jgi:tetratricopeptide (TPR) repeat protein
MRSKKLLIIFITGVISALVLFFVFLRNDETKTLFKNGKSRVESNDYERAIRYYIKMIELNIDNEEAYLKLEAFRSVIQDFTKAIALNPKNADSYRGRGILKGILQDYRGAIQDLTKAMDLNELKIKKKWAKEMESYFCDKNPFFKFCSKEDPFFEYDGQEGMLKNIESYFHGLVVNKHKLEEFDSIYLPSYYRNPQNTSSIIQRGKFKRKLEDFYGAIFDYSTAIQMDPKNAIAYYLRGRAKISWMKKKENNYLRIDSKILDKYKNSGCIDFSKAGELGHPKAYEAIQKFCQ